MVKLLVEGGADLHASSSRAGWTALHYAAHAGNTSFARALVRMGFDKAKRNKRKETPRELALKKGYAECASVLR